MKSNLTELKFQEIPELIKVTKEHFNESKYSVHGYDVERAVQTLSGLIQDPDAIVYVVRHDNKIVGYVAGGKLESSVSNYTYTWDEGFYVLPEYRNGRYSVQLVQAFIKWAKENNVDYITVANNTYEYDKTGGVDKFLRRLGFELTAGIYEYRGSN